MSDRVPSNPNIQLPVGPGPDETGTWQISLGEIDAMCRKAARGAGFSWGMAEEAGRAARLLACHGLPGAEAIAALLPLVDAAVARFAPLPQQDGWTSDIGELCPLCLGAALSDRAQDIAGGLRVETGPVLYPILVLPFLMAAGRDLGVVFALEGEEFAAWGAGAGPACSDWGALAALGRSAGISVFPSEDVGAPQRPRQAAAHPIQVDIWRRLGSFAARTYAPATEESRLSGAGAGITDRD